MLDRLDQLDVITARLETLAARLDAAVPEDASPAGRDAIISASEETLTIVCGEVARALAAGATDEAQLRTIACAPLLRALAAVPPAQQASARLQAISALVTFLVARLADVHRPRPSAPPAGWSGSA